MKTVRRHKHVISGEDPSRWLKSLQKPSIFVEGNGLLPSDAVYLVSRKECDEVK